MDVQFLHALEPKRALRFEKHLRGTQITDPDMTKTPRNEVYTLPETNIAPENGWLEYWFPFWMAYFQGPC